MGPSLMTLPFDIRARIFQLAVPDTDVNCNDVQPHDLFQRAFNALPFLLVSRAFNDDLREIHLPKLCINTTIAALVPWLDRLSTGNKLSNVRSFKVLARFDSIYNVLVQNDEKLARRELWVRDLLRHCFSEVEIEQSVEIVRIKYPLSRQGPAQPNIRRAEIEILVVRMIFTVARPVATIRPASNIDSWTIDFEDNITRHGAQHPRLTLLEEFPVWPPVSCQKNRNTAGLPFKTAAVAKETVWRRAKSKLRRTFRCWAFYKWTRR
jgi:hypothetical protein